MGFTRKAFLLTRFLFLMCAHFVAAQTVAQDRPEITILVFNSARVLPADLARSEQQGAMIFREADINTVWVDCAAGSAEQACHQPPGPNQFVLHIVPRGQTSTDTVFGMAFLGDEDMGKYTNVFYDRIEQLHRDSGASPAGLLGTVAAHEIGHLLLGSNSHSSTGIMAARWEKEELQRLSMGCLRFTPEQASRMRSRIEEWQRRAENALLARTESSARSLIRLPVAFGRLYQRPQRFD